LQKPGECASAEPQLFSRDQDFLQSSWLTHSYPCREVLVDLVAGQLRPLHDVDAQAKPAAGLDRDRQLVACHHLDLRAGGQTDAQSGKDRQQASSCSRHSVATSRAGRRPIARSEWAIAAQPLQTQRDTHGRQTDIGVNGPSPPSPLQALGHGRPTATVRHLPGPVIASPSQEQGSAYHDAKAVRLLDGCRRVRTRRVQQRDAANKHPALPVIHRLHRRVRTREP
jgi:hypothetical protein